VIVQLHSLKPIQSTSATDIIATLALESIVGLTLLVFA
jgi:hypothetical protein